MLIAWLAAALASAGPPVIEAPEKIPMGISAQALPDGYRLTLKTTEMLEIGAA